MAKEKIIREKVQLDKSIDQTGNSFQCGEDFYKQVDEIERHGDGQEHDIIMKREKDGKFFKYSWCYFPDSCSEAYDFDTEMVEVFETTKITYQ